MRWSARETVAGFAQSPPNETLMRYAGDLGRTLLGNVALDIGCGAARNGVPLAKAGWRVIGTDTSEPMLEAAARRFRQEGLDGRATLVRATMDAFRLQTALPISSSRMGSGILRARASSSERRCEKRRVPHARVRGCSCSHSRVTRCQTR